MFEDYQSEQATEAEFPTAPPHAIATVGAVYSDGVTLIFPGASAASTKHYKTNRDITLSAGDRVYVVKISGTYIIVCRL